jgi:hypothetical protein
MLSMGRVAAATVREPVRLLDSWPSYGPFVALSSHNVRYRDEDVEAFIAGRIVAPTDRAGD